MPDASYGTDRSHYGWMQGRYSPKSCFMKLLFACGNRVALLIILIGATLSGCSEHSSPKPHIIRAGGIHNCGEQPVVIEAYDQRIDLQGQCSSVVVRGAANTISIQAASRILIEGPGNLLSVAAADEVTARSSGNSISYARGLSRARPVVVATGDNNSLIQLR